MKKVLILFSILLISFVINGSELDIQTKNGVLQGKYLTKDFFTIIGRQFLGIPYASPPVSNLRWKPPQPPSSWSGVRSAKDYGNNCWQSDTTFTPRNKMSEDCLYLDVYLPLEKDINGTLPVMIFFFGGSWQWGAASWPPYSGKGTLENGAKVIVINANYRLGPLGFFGIPYMKNISQDGSIANYGLQDQRAAMQWIQDNIAAFGGDPKRVTIWGESAGAGSVSNHLVDKRSWGLFHQGIMESGPIASFWIARPLEWVYIQSSQMITNSVCSKYTNQDLYNCLLNLNATELMRLPAKIPQDNMITWGPCVDGVELEDLPGNLAAKGQIAPNVNVLFGTNKNEGSLFTPHLSHDATVQQYFTWAHTEFKPTNDTLVEEVLRMYPVSEFDSPWWAASYIVGDAYMSCPARRTARWISKIPGNKVFLYFWDYLLLEFRPDIYLGVFHGSEIPFVFNDETGLYGDIPIIMTSEEETLAKNINNFWTSFVINGVPSVPGLPTWPAYTLQNDASMVLNMNSTVISGLKNIQCNLWDNIPLPPYVPSAIPQKELSIN